LNLIGQLWFFVIEVPIDSKVNKAKA